MKEQQTQFEESSPSLEAEARGKRRWALLSLGLAALSIWGVSNQWKGFSFAAFVEDLALADQRWFVPALLAMLGYIAFEACAIRAGCRALGHPVRLTAGCCFAAADIYFSAITPSATGGQPASMLLMRRAGIPLVVGAAVMLLTLAMYAAATLVLGSLCLLLSPEVLAIFDTPSRVLIGLGFVVQVLLAVFFFLLLWRERLLEGLLLRLFDLLARLKLIPRAARRRARLAELMADYRVSAALLGGQRGLLVRSFFFCLLQRLSQLAVTVFCFLSLGGPPRMAGEIFSMQSFVVIGAYCVPLPGGMGVADYLLLDGFEAFLPSDLVVSMELLSRSLSFYICILLCGLLVFFNLYRNRKAGRSK